MSTVLAIDKRSLDRKAADWIRGAIVSGEFSPGEKLTELSLAAQIGLSRSTVRAAMQRLAGEGLLVQHAYTGWEVVSLSWEDAWELYTLRSSLEGMATRLAAQRINDAGRALLFAALEELQAAIAQNDRRRIAQADLNIHKSIVSLSGHRRLSMQYGLVVDPVQLYIQSTNSLIESDETIYHDHRQLVEAISRGDAIEAERLATEHVQKNGERLVERLKASQPAAHS